jgi:hypothetical protein
VPGGQVKDLKTDWKDVLLKINPLSGSHDLFFVFKNPQSKGALFHIDHMYFEK